MKHKKKLLIFGLIVIITSIAIIISTVLLEEEEISDTGFATKTFGLEPGEFEYIEKNSRNSTRIILSVLIETGGDVEKTIKILNGN